MTPLGPVSLLDCVVFVLLLAPQLILQAGFFPTLVTGLAALPFLLFTLPAQLIRARIRHGAGPPPPIFRDTALRCIRYGFKHVPPEVGRVFFAREVSLPFLRFRLLRHGYRSYPTYWREVTLPSGCGSFGGIWIRHDPAAEPDFVLYYIHGGGFALGSSYFYLEFLLTWHGLLLGAGYQNPAVFGLEYSLVPDRVYPAQLAESLAGYRHVLQVAGSPARVCLGADSAGSALALGVLLEIGAQGRSEPTWGWNGGLAGDGADAEDRLPTPELAVLISPWTTLMAAGHHRNTDEDYLDTVALWRYGHRYAGAANMHRSPACPGSCRDQSLWRAAAPSGGYFVIYGGSEIMAADIRNFIAGQRAGLGAWAVSAVELEGQVHAWPVAALFLAETAEQRLERLAMIVSHIRERMPACGPVGNGKATRAASNKQW